MIAGQDLHTAPSTGHPLEEIYGSGTSQYEYFTSIAPDDVPAVLALVGLDPDADPLDELPTLSTDDAFELTAQVREAGLDHDRFSWAG